MKTSHNNQDLEKAIVKTMAFFDLFSYPLTALEIWQYLSEEIDFIDFQIYLKSLRLRSVIFKQEGFYFFPDRAEIINVRKKRYNYFQKKLKLVKRWNKFFKLISGVKAIFIANIIGSSNLRLEGDIDLFIICKDNRVWRSRFILTFFAKILGLRPSFAKEKDKFCLSFFVSEKSLNFNNLRLKSDPYFAYWLLGLKEVGDDKYFEQVLSSNIFWLKEIFPNYFKVVDISQDLVKDNRESKDRLVFRGLEKYFYRLQWRLFPEVIKSKANKGTEVVLNSQILKLHVLDRRLEFSQKYLDTIKKYEAFL